MLIPTTFIVAQNATLEGMEGSLTLDENQTIAPDEPSNLTEPDNETSANVTINITNQTGTEPNETLPVNETENQTAQNETFETNLTINITNQTGTEPNETLPVNETENATSDESDDITNVTTNQTETPPEKPELHIEIFSPEQITRGESYSFEARVSNKGQGTARDVILYWLLPDGFVILRDPTWTNLTKSGGESLSGSGSVDCQEVAPQTSCWNNITATAPLSSIGNYDIKVRVSYSE